MHLAPGISCRLVPVVALVAACLAAPATAQAAPEDYTVDITSMNSEYTFSENGRVWMDVTVTNDATDQIAPTTVHVTLPDDLAFVPADSSADCTGSDQRVTCTTPVALGQDEAGTFPIVAAMLRPGGGRAVASIDPAVTCGWDDPQPGCGWAGFSLYGFSDLSTTLTWEPSGPAVVGARGTFALTTTNDGHVSDASVGLVIPRGLRFESVPAGCTGYESYAYCPIVELADGGTSVVRFAVVITEEAAGRSLFVDFSSDAANIDMVPNHGAPYTLDVPAAADLGLSVDVQLGLSATAATATYALRVVNSGPSDVTDASVSFVLPAGIGAPSGDGCAAAIGGWRCTFPAIASGGSATRTVTAQVPLTDAARTLTTRFAVASSATDQVTGNDAAAASVTVGALGTVAPVAVGPTAGPDTLIAGTTGSTLTGGAGDDALHGLNGDDVLRGGPGADRLFGGRGADRISGNAGADRIYGDAGDDAIDGGAGADTLVGGEGADLVRGGAGDDPKVWGGAGNDRLFGGPGRDGIVGGAGHDVVDARDGRAGDRIDCGPGRDSVRADRGDQVSASCERRMIG